MNEHIAGNPSLQTPSIKLAHVRVLNAMLRHSVGIRWLIKTKSWTYVLAYCMENLTIYVVRESYKFMAAFTNIVASDLNDAVLCTEILDLARAPIQSALVIENDTIHVDNDNLQRTVVPALKLLCVIMKNNIISGKKSCLARILCIDKPIKGHLWRLTDMTLDKEFFKIISGSLAILNFLEYVDQLDNKESTKLGQNVFGLNFFNQMKFCMVHDNAHALLACAKLYHHIWTSLAERLPEEIELEGNSIKFENQIITLQLTPILMGIVPFKDEPEWEIFDTFIMNLFDISADHTLRVCYAFRDLLTKNRSILSSVACKSIQAILAMKNLHRERAVYVFQALCYSLKDFVRNERGPSHVHPIAASSDQLIDKPHLLSAILIGLYELIKEHHITWKESIESMCLLDFLLMLLSKPTLTAQVSELR